MDNQDDISTDVKAWNRWIANSQMYISLEPLVSFMSLHYEGKGESWVSWYKEWESLHREDGHVRQAQDFHPGDSCSCPVWNRLETVRYFSLVTLKLHNDVAILT